MEKIEHNFSYLQGEYNACKAVGTACDEASQAISAKFRDRPEDAHFILIEVAGIMSRASMLIKIKNGDLGVEGMYQPKPEGT